MNAGMIKEFSAVMRVLGRGSVAEEVASYIAEQHLSHSFMPETIEFARALLSANQEEK